MYPYCLLACLCSLYSLCFCLVKSYAAFKDYLTCYCLPVGYNLLPFYNHSFFCLPLSFFFLLKCKLSKTFIFLHYLSIVFVPRSRHLVSKINETYSQAFRNSFPIAPDIMPSVQEVFHKYFGKGREKGGRGHSNNNHCRVKLDIILWASLIKY